MGIKDLMKFVDDCTSNKSLTDYLGTHLTVDALQQLFKYGITIRKKGFDFINQDGKIINHLYSILKSVSFFTSLASYPYYIFDGKTPEQKKGCIDNRKKKKEEAEDKCSDNITKEDFLKYFKRSYNLDRTQIQEVQELLDYMGIPYIQSIWEADPQCVALSYYYKNISGIVSDDADMLVFGAPKLLKNFNARSDFIKEITHENILSFLTNKKNKILEEFKNTYVNLNISKNLLEFNFDRTNLADIAILFGSEYTNPNYIKNITSLNLFTIYVLCDCDIDSTIELLQKFIDNKKQNQQENKESINSLTDIAIKILKNDCNDLTISDGYFSVWKTAKEYYLSANVIHPNSIEIKIKPPNREKILNLLCTKNNFDKNEINTFIDKIEHLYYIFNNANDKNKIKQYQMKYIRNRHKNIHNQFIPKNKTSLISSKDDEETKYNIDDMEDNETTEEDNNSNEIISMNKTYKKYNIYDNEDILKSSKIKEYKFSLGIF